MTHTAQHTPGPWAVKSTDEDINTKTIIDSHEFWIAKVLNFNRASDDIRESQANANLIAAAPAMYEALQHAAMSYHHPACKCKGEYSANPELYCTCHVQKAQAALAQAEGRRRT